MDAQNKNKRLYPKFSVEIRGHKWQVYVVSHEDMGLLSSSDVFGFCNQAGKRIFLENTMHYDLMLRTFLHEFLHAALGPASGGNSEKMPIADFEELCCDSFGEAGPELLNQAQYIMMQVRKHAAPDSGTIEQLISEAPDTDEEDSDG
jgi:hypothetical protein